jgi:non-specific serine/threonine protein kinase
MAIKKTDLEALVQEVTAAGSQLRGPDAETWAAQLDRDHARIEQALAWLLENDPTIGLELALALPDYWHLRGQWGEGRAWLERLLAAVREPTPTLRCRALSSLSGLAFRLGDNESARARANDALTIARGLGDARLIVGALTRLARVGLRDNDPRRTIALSREAMALADAAGDEELSLQPLHCLAEATRMTGDYEGARDLYRRSLDLNRKRGDDMVIGTETSNLATVELRFGNFDAAVRLWREALTLAHRTENRYLLPYAVAGLGEVAAAQRDWDRAARLLGAADGLFRASGAAIDPADVPAFDSAVAATRAGLTDAFDRAWSHGESLTADETVAFALRSSQGGT